MSEFIMPEMGLIVVGKADNLLTDGGLNEWDDATHLTHWEEILAESSTVNREATEKIEGDYSARLDVDGAGSNVYFRQTLTLVPNKRYEFILWYKNSIAGKTAVIYLLSIGAAVYLKEDGTWNVGAYPITLPSSTVWKPVKISFNAHPDHSNYRIQLGRGSATSSSIYFDKLSIKEVGEFVPKTIGTMNFDSGSVEPQVDETLRGATSGSLAKVVSVTKSGGTWGGGDAVGSISLTECEGRFHDNENIDGMVGGTNILTVNHPDTGAGVDLVRNGEYEAGVGGWTPLDCTLASIAGGQVGNCIELTRTGGSVQYFSQLVSGLTIGKIYKFVGSVKSGTSGNQGFSMFDSNHNEFFIQVASSGDFVQYTKTFKAKYSSVSIRLRKDTVTAGTMLFDEVSLYELTPDEVVADGKTLMVNSVIFVPTDADGDRLLLTDYDGNTFVDIKGKANTPTPIFFKKPRKLNGLKVAIIESGKAYIYLAKK